MSLSEGTRLGPYEILSPLGAGGMGEVYRARDSRLGRDVAIKLLPDIFAADPERTARFEREARLLASLHHGNIATLYGLEESEGRRFLVMECVEGESLATRLARGPLTLHEALEAGRAVSSALEAAHEAGIVHRDLKPANVMVTPSGEYKVLDFGLAKAGGAGGSKESSDSLSPTMTRGATQAGVMLGTAAYMSPEQARGKEVDKRTDIWSFGCLLYECLTAKQAFAGETASDVVAVILQGEPNWGALPATTPDRLRALIGRCLEKDAKRRQRDIGDVRIELEDLLAARASSSSMKATSLAARGGRLPAWAWMALGVLLAAVAIAAFQLLAPRAKEAVSRFEVAGPAGQQLNGDGGRQCISPDGRTLAMVAADSAGVNHLWVRSMEAVTPRQLPGTDNVTLMFWSPDSRQLAFFAADKALYRVALAGGDPEKICEARAARGGAWNRSNVILFAPYSNGGLFKVSAEGGTPVAVTHPDSSHGVTGHRFPQFLPDGKHFLFACVPPAPNGLLQIRMGSLDGGNTREIMHTQTAPRFVSPDWVLFTREGRLVAQRINPGSGKLQRMPVSLGDLPSTSEMSGCPPITSSDDGDLAYSTSFLAPSRLVWLDLQGHPTGTVPLKQGFFGGPKLFPDDRRATLLWAETPSSPSSAVIVDLERGTTTRISEPGELVDDAQSSPDGQQVAYMLGSGGGIVVKSLADGIRRELLQTNHSFKRLYGWTPDGKELLIGLLDPITRWDIWMLPVDGTAAPIAMLKSPANEGPGALSPDGRWLGYASDESGGVPEIYVQPMGAPGARYQVTSGGGVGGFWSHDGSGLRYIRAQDPYRILAAEVIANPTFSLGPARSLCVVPEENRGAVLDRPESRILASMPATKAPAQTLTVVQHWRAGLRKP